MVETKEIKNVPGLNPDDVVVIKKFGFKSMAKVRNKITLDFSGNANVPMGDLQLAYLVYGIESASFFPKNASEQEKEQIVNSDDFSVAIVDFLYPEIAKLNNHEVLQDLKKK